MGLFGRIFDSYIGILSLFVIAFILGMGVWFYRFFMKKIEEEERTKK